MWYSGIKGDIWVEYKYIRTIPIRPKTMVIPGLAPLQLVWLHHRHKEGRRVFVVVGCPKGGVVFGPDEWADGIDAGWFTQKLHSRNQLALWLFAIVGRGLDDEAPSS